MTDLRKIIEEEEIKKGKDALVELVFFVSASVGIISLIYSWGKDNGIDTSRPTSAVYRDVNSDSYNDMIITSRGKTETVLYGQKDERYLSAEEIRNSEQKNLEEKLRAYQSTSQKAENSTKHTSLKGGTN